MNRVFELMNDPFGLTNGILVSKILHEITKHP